MDGLWLCMLVGRDYNLLFAVIMYSGVAVARAHVLRPVCQRAWVLISKSRLIKSRILCLLAMLVELCSQT